MPAGLLQVAGARDPEECGDEMDDISELSDDASDASDIFHVSVAHGRMKNATRRTPATLEDAQLEKARALALLMRDHPRLPPHPHGANLSWTDVSSGIRFPIAHCAFKGCRWCVDAEGFHSRPRGWFFDVGLLLSTFSRRRRFFCCRWDRKRA